MLSHLKSRNGYGMADINPRDEDEEKEADVNSKNEEEKRVVRCKPHEKGNFLQNT